MLYLLSFQTLGGHHWLIDPRHHSYPSQSATDQLERVVESSYRISVRDVPYSLYVMFPGISWEHLIRSHDQDAL